MFKKITRNFTLSAFLILFGLNGMAQDVIYFINGDKINSVVQEIGIDYVKYKKFDNQMGPTYNVAKTEIFMIKYENGTKEVFNEVVKPEVPKIEQYEKPDNNSYYKLKNEFYKIGKDDKKMLDFFRKNNFPEYSYYYASACRKREAGTGLLVSGIGLSGIGIILLIEGGKTVPYYGPHYIYPYQNYRHKHANYEDFYIAGAVLLSVGQILTIISIPISASAGIKKNDIKEGFANTYFGIYSDMYQPKLNIGITQSGGVGLTLHF